VPFGYLLHERIHSSVRESVVEIPSLGAEIIRVRGTADDRVTFAQGLRNPHGLAFREGYLYIAAENQVVRFRLKKSLPFDVEKAALSYDVQRNNGSVQVVAAVSPASARLL